MDIEKKEDILLILIVKKIPRTFYSYFTWVSQQNVCLQVGVYFLFLITVCNVNMDVTD